VPSLVIWLAGVFALSLLLGAAPPSRAAEKTSGSEAIAVVVNLDVPVDNVSFADLRSILLGNRQYGKTGKPITLLVRAPVSTARDVLLKKIYQMSEPQFQQYWVAKVFRAESTSGPKIVLSNEMTVQLLEVIPGAVSLLDSSKVGPNMKVLKIDGLLPEQQGYPLEKTAPR